MTEPGTGSDLQAIKTNAQPDGDGYRLNGSKTFITNGQHAGVVIVAAKDAKAGGKGMTLFLVDTEQLGRAHVELQSLMRISYAVFCLKKKKIKQHQNQNNRDQ